MNDADKLLQTIRERNLQPVPKSWFLWRNRVIWAAFVLAVLGGACAFSVILFSVQQADYTVWQHLGHSGLETVLALLPFLWLAMLLVGLGVGLWSYQRSPKGYKLPLGQLVAYYTGLSMVLGTLTFYAGGSQQLDRIFESQLQMYESVQARKVKLWSLPEQGYLSGKITAVDSTVLTLEDFQQQRWNVDYEQAVVRSMVRLEAGEVVKIIGKMPRKGQFDAAEVRPWGGRR